MQEDLGFVWDKKAQEFCEARIPKNEPDTMHDVTEYLDFLAEIIPDKEDPFRNDFVKKPFTL